jgi:hypothetical protein
MKTLKPTWMRLALTGLVAASLAGCAADLVTNADTDKKQETEKHVVDGTVHTRQIDASNKDVWIYYSLATNAEVTPETPKDSKDWDLSFRRSKIHSNGGDSGKGGVEVAKLDNQDFDALTTAPADGYATDDGKFRTDMPNDPDTYSVFLGEDSWYNYGAGHSVTPKEKRVYVIKTTAGKYVKLQMLSYYSDDAKSGYPKFKYAEIEAPHQH